MKKIILTAFIAVTALGLTSCNKDPEPIVFTPQSILTFDVAELMRFGLLGIFDFEELVSAKISKGETLDPAIILKKDAADTIIGWEANLSEQTVLATIFGGKIVVNFTGEPLDDGSKKLIDCSEVTVSSSSLKLFGSIEITNISTTTNFTETVRKVETTAFGWGKTANDVSLSANYTFESKYNSALALTECKASGQAIGYHVVYQNFDQEITSTLSFAGNAYFTSGAMTLYALGIGNGILPINAVFNSGTVSITYDGKTETYNQY